MRGCNSQWIRKSLGILGAISLFVIAGSTTVTLAQESEEFKNLKVLHKDIPKDELISLMKSFTQALGVRCEHCHVQVEGEGQRSDWDFPSDEKDPKRAARVMIQMVNAINADHLSRLEEHGEEGHAEEEREHAVTCATCHRGHEEPETIEQALEHAYEKGGVANVAAEFRTLREKYYGGAGYDFRVSGLNRFATQLVDQQKFDDALAVLDLNSEFYPESDQIEVFKALTYLNKGDSTTSIVHLRKAVELNPENRWAKRTLNELTGE